MSMTLCLSPYAVFKIFLEAFFAGFHTDTWVGSCTNSEYVSIPIYSLQRKKELHSKAITY